MAEMLGPYDPASPSLTTSCKRITSADYEKEGSDYTQQALTQLIQYLEYNPTAYHNVLRKRKREDAENAGVFSWLKVKMLSTVYGEEHCENMSDDALRQKLTSLKSEMVSSYNYAEEAKGSGRRISKRIANKIKPKQTAPYFQTEDEAIKKNLDFELCSETNKTPKQRPQKTATEATSNKEREANFIPRPPEMFSIPPPPPPPPPVASFDLQMTTVAQSSVNLSKAHTLKKLKEKTAIPARTNEVKLRPVTRERAGLCDRQVESCGSGNIVDLMNSLKNPQVRASLKAVSNKDFTPYQLRQRTKAKETEKENEFPIFNQELIAKFQNARSPDTPENSKYMSDISSPDSFLASP